MRKTRNEKLRCFGGGLFWALLLQVALCSSASAQARERSYTVSPSSVEQGKEYELTIRSITCDLIRTDLVAPVGSGITVAIAVGINDCTMLARIVVAKDAPVDTVVLRVTKQSSVLGLIDLPVRRGLPYESPAAPAQPPASPSSSTTIPTRDPGDEAPRVEVFGGYSYARADFTDLGHVNLNGWTASVAGNFNRYIGIAGDVSGHYKAVLGARVNFYSFLVGPRVYARNRYATTFAHALFGVSHGRGTVLGFTASETAFAAAFGAGVDVNVHPNVAIRAIQADYLLTRFSDILGDRRTQSNLRLSAGIVFRFGR